MAWAKADAEAGIRETDGHDRSPRIDAINRFVGNPVGSPFCAAGVSWCFHAAGADDFPFSGLAKSIRDALAARGLLSRNPADLMKWRGALFGWTNPDGHGHIGFVAERLTNSSGQVADIGTVEYNTDPAGGRDGHGVYCRRRAVGPGHDLWFLRTDGFKGGAWWTPEAET